MKRVINQVKNIKLQHLKSALVLGVLALMVLLLARGVWSLWQRNRFADGQQANSEEHLASLEKRKAFLEKKVSDLKTPRGLEEELRLNFSVIKPGEKVINLIDENKATISASTTPKRAWWQIF